MSVFTTQPATAIQAEPSADVILHAFDWPYQKVASEAKRIAQLGYHSVLISPPLKSPDEEKWWMRYQPQDYRVIENPLGNTLDFIDMLHALQRHNVRLYVDVVFNHMANEAHLRHDLTYPNADIMAQYQTRSDHYQSLTLFGDLSQPLFSDSDFEPAFPIKNWTDAQEVQTGRLSGGDDDPGLPTLATTDNVISQQKAYIKAMKTLGVNGFRIDAAKHISLDHLTKVWTADLCEGVKVFGEIITDGGAGKAEYDVFLKPFIDHTPIDAYDFPMFHALLSIFKYGNSMQTLLALKENEQCLDPKRAITFAVTHDIPNNGIFRNQLFTPQQEHLVYCYLLGCCDGSPLIYTDLNTSNDVDALGNPRWVRSWHDNSLVKMLHFHQYVHGQESHVLLCNDATLVILRGSMEKPAGIIALNLNEQEINLAIPTADYNVWLGGDDLLSNNQLTVPAQSGVMLMA
ncbi:alpha-amylase family glycosyl hydrolase [Vibrio rumoiensis]|uniref:Alpha-amylase n=1 Tax=Vibrio rumoiensis 1S-45 TaxID=1188252 RepID=A0A1E5DZZ3_9VIBR|nr:alpha-amylase family glycosyl hydrolase [Vibrio rumoiensis]OEF23608.1 alpha-amylase [Vibrio rumoiensis 1S-45]